MTEATNSLKDKTRDFVKSLKDKQFGEVNIEIAPSDNKLREQNEEEILKREGDTTVINNGGNFEIQVHIQELRDLVGKDLSGSSDPVVTVTIMDQKKSTKKVDKQLNITLDQILFFSLKSLESGQLLKTKCLIEVFDHNHILKNEIIGCFEFNLGSIYYQPHHEIFNQWIGLANNKKCEQQDYETDDDGTSDGIQGSLKCSICVLGANDEQYIHNEHEYDDHQTSNYGLILLPPSITQTPNILTVKIYEYDNLAPLDSNTSAILERFQHDLEYYNDKDTKMNITPNKLFNVFKAMVPDLFSDDSKDENLEKKRNRLDPFFVVDFGGIRMRSIDYHSKDLQGIYKNVSCKEVCLQFDLPVMEPTYCDEIQIEFWDKDTMSDNDLISIIRINYHKIKKHRMKQRWHYMYGAPIGHETNKYAKKMNKGYIEGTYFRGRSLIEIIVESKPEKPPKQLTKFTDKQNNTMYRNYELICNVYQGTEIYLIGKEYKNMFVEISVGRECKHIFPKTDNEKNKENKTNIKQFNFNESLLKLSINDLPSNESEWDDTSIPYIFIYLCTGNPKKPENSDRIAYHRISINEIIGNQSYDPPIWYDMKEDIVLDKYPKNTFPGSLLISFYMNEIVKSKQDEHIQNITSSTSEQDRKYEAGPAKMIIYNMAAMHLPKTDKFGTCDPCIEFRIANKMNFKGLPKKTSIQHNTLDPTWYSCAQRIEFENVDIGDELHIMIKDDDSVIDIMPVFEEVAEIEHPIKLRTKEEDEIVGDWIELIKPKKNKSSTPFTHKPLLKIHIKYEFNDNITSNMEHKKRQKKLEELSAISGDFMSKKTNQEKPRKMQLRADIYLGKNIRTSDLTSLCDAYVQVRFCGKTDKTVFIVDRSDPEWFQTLILKDITVPWPLKYAPKIYCSIFDKNFVNKDVLIGRFEEIPKIVYEKKEDYDEKKEENASLPPPPCLYQLKSPENNGHIDGEVLAGFRLTEMVEIEEKEENKENKENVIRKPEKELHSIHIIVLGIRDISSLLGVHDCYIQFELGGKKYRTKKSNDPEPWNANYCEIIHFDVQLPGKENAMFLPNLNVSIIDSLFGGLIERNIGYASIKVAELMKNEDARIECLTKQQETLKHLFNDIENNKNQQHKDSQSIDSDDDIDQTENEQMALLGNNNGERKGTKKKRDKDKDKNKNDSKDEKEKGFVFFKHIDDKANIFDIQSTFKESRRQKSVNKEYENKFMIIDGIEREQYDDELEDILPKKLHNEYLLSPFLSQPLFSGGTKNRNIGTFKGLISFAPKQSNLLQIDIYECRDLWKPDENRIFGGGLLNPYIVVEFAGIKTKSKNEKPEMIENKEIDDILDDDWRMNQRFKIPVIEPVFADNITISVWDHNEDIFNPDDKIGYLRYSYSKIKEMDNGIELNWYSLIHPNNANNNELKKSDVGEIYFKIHVKETKKTPKRGVEEIESDEYEKAKTNPNYKRSKDYKLEIKKKKREKKESEMKSMEMEVIIIDEDEDEDEKEEESKKVEKKEDLDYNLSIECIREITEPQQLYLRLYILNGLKMKPPNGDSELNDPYLRIRISQQIQCTKTTDILKKKIVNKATVNPDFYESFEFAIEMPGPSKLKIECWDESIFGIKDSLIGETIIDIEDRWYDQYWRYLPLKPVEERTMKLHNMSHGKLRLWMEILTVDEKKKTPNMIDISQPAKQPYELRLIIWETKNIPVHDEGTSMNDLFCTASMSDGSDKQSTDLHFRSEAGWQCWPGNTGKLTTDGSFNWRMKFRIESLRKSRNKRLEIQVWDKDYFSSNDYIGSITLSLNKFFAFCELQSIKQRCIYVMKEPSDPLKLTDEQKIELPLRDQDGFHSGSIVITLELIPYKLIEEYPAGIGRKEPNKNPYLPDPTNRAELSLFHPFKSLRLLIGKRLCLKLSICLFCTFLITFIVMIFPNLFTEIVADSITH